MKKGLFNFDDKHDMKMKICIVIHITCLVFHMKAPNCQIIEYTYARTR